MERRKNTNTPGNVLSYSFAGLPTLVTVFNDIIPQAEILIFLSFLHFPHRVAKTKEHRNGIPKTIWKLTEYFGPTFTQFCHTFKVVANYAL